MTSYPNLIKALGDIAEAHPENAAVRRYLAGLQQPGEQPRAPLTLVHDEAREASPFVASASR